MRFVSSFNELLPNDSTGFSGGLGVFNDVATIDQTVQGLNRSWEILRAGLREIYEIKKDDFWARKNKDPDREEYQRRYNAVRPAIDDAVDSLKSGVQTVNQEVRQEADRIAGLEGRDAAKSFDRLRKKQQEIAGSFLGNPDLLGDAAFKPIEIQNPTAVAKPQPERPRFATREEAAAYYQQQKKNQ